MKQLFAILSFVIFCGVSLQAQRFENSVYLGGSFSQVDGDATGHYNHLGIRGGVGTNFSITDNEDSPLRMMIELGVVQKGSYVNSSDISINLTYVELPLLLAFRGEKFRLGVGVAPGLLVRANVLESGVYAAAASENYRRMDRLPLCADLHYHFSGHWGVDLRYENSFLTVTHESAIGTYRLFRSNKGTFNRLLSATLTYSF